MSENYYVMTVGELLDHIQELPRNSKLVFGSGDLQFDRTKWINKDLLKIEFKQTYSITFDPNEFDLK